VTQVPDRELAMVEKRPVGRVRADGDEKISKMNAGLVQNEKGPAGGRVGGGKAPNMKRPMGRGGANQGKKVKRNL